MSVRKPMPEKMKKPARLLLVMPVLNSIIYDIIKYDQNVYKNFSISLDLDMESKLYRLFVISILLGIW